MGEFGAPHSGCALGCAGAWRCAFARTRGWRSFAQSVFASTGPHMTRGADGRIGLEHYFYPVDGTCQGSEAYQRSFGSEAVCPSRFPASGTAPESSRRAHGE